MSSLVTRHLGTFWASHHSKRQQVTEKATLRPTRFHHTTKAQCPLHSATRTINPARTGAIHTFALRGTRYQGSRRLMRWGVNTYIRSTLGREHSPVCRHHTVDVCLCRIQFCTVLHTGRLTRMGRGRTVVARLGLGRTRRLCHRWAMGDIDLVVVARRCAVRLCKSLPGPGNVVVGYEMASTKRGT
jgi:hypothetical protein